MNDTERMHRVDAELSHVWMVRTFIKHSEESAVDDELREVYRDLYDVMHALGPAIAADDAATYLKQARKKLGKLKSAAEVFAEIQPEISGHTNFLMATRSLAAAVEAISTTLAD